jgi:hypothetical protein
MTGLAAVRSPVRRLIPRLLNSGDRSYLRGAVGLNQKKLQSQVGFQKKLQSQQKKMW